MRYMTVYVEVASAGSNDAVRSALTGTLSGLALKTRDGYLIGQVIHAQVTEGPKPTRQPGSAS